MDFGQSAPGSRHGKAVASEAAPIWYAAAVFGPESLHGLSRAGASNPSPASANCVSTCRGFETVLPTRGMTAEEWQHFLPSMTENRWGRSFFTDQARVAQLAHGLEQLFGPEGTLGPSARPDLSKVKHTPVSDAALRATFTEYIIPARRTMPHSVIVDDKSGTVWFSEYDSASNKMAHFNPETEHFDQFPIPVPQSNAHTGAVLKDGNYLVGLDRPGADGKVAGVDRDGKVVVYEFPVRPQGSRMVVADPTREDTAWLAAGDEV